MKQTILFSKKNAYKKRVFFKIYNRLYLFNLLFNYLLNNRQDATMTVTTMENNPLITEVMSLSFKTYFTQFQDLNFISNLFISYLLFFFYSYILVCFKMIHYSTLATKTTRISFSDKNKSIG